MTRVSCASCIYNEGKCDIYGVQTSPMVVCRMYLPEREVSHEEALERWPILQTLDLGVIYTYGDDPAAPHEPEPLYPGLRNRARRAKGVQRPA